MQLTYITYLLHKCYRLMNFVLSLEVNCKRNSKSENKSADNKGDTESEREKMFALDRFAFFKQTVKYREKRKRDAADHSAEDRAEKRAENKNHDSARRARNAAPEQTDKRQREHHYRPTVIFK